MKMIAVPKLLHELFGRKTTLVELLLVLTFALTMSAFLFVFTYEELAHLPLWKTILIALLLVDIYGGVVANLTRSTNDYYKLRPGTRLVFIAIHVQPILLAVLFNDYYAVSLAVWGYTILASLFVNLLKDYPAQRIIGAILALTGIVGLILWSGAFPSLLLITLLFYMLKVIYSFAVDHYATHAS